MSRDCKTAWLSLLLVLLALPCGAQDLEPRRWSHLPIDTNHAAIAYAYTTTDIAVDPVLLIEDVEMEMHTWAIAYIRAFEFLGKSARVDLLQAWQDGRWTGAIDGVPTTVTRQGWADLIGRFAINLIGAPPLSGKEYQAYRASLDTETIVGAGLVVQFPTGEYMEDKLINLGSNRFTFRPQFAVVHSRNDWSFEATGAVSIYTDNTSFFNGNRLEQEPLYSLQVHIVRTFRPSLWLAASGGYSFGERSTVSGDKKDNEKENVSWGVSIGYRFTNWLGAKAAYLANRRLTPVGLDSDTLVFSLSTTW